MFAVQQEHYQIIHLNHPLTGHVTPTMYSLEMIALPLLPHTALPSITSSHIIRTHGDGLAAVIYKQERTYASALVHPHFLHLSPQRSVGLRCLILQSLLMTRPGLHLMDVRSMPVATSEANVALPLSSAFLPIRQQMLPVPLLLAQMAVSQTAAQTLSTISNLQQNFFPLDTLKRLINRGPV
jgi:hypothetical protein